MTTRKEEGIQNKNLKNFPALMCEIHADTVVFVEVLSDNVTG